MLIMVTRQAGNACMASLIFIESFHGGVNKAKVRHHCFTRPVSITGKNGVNDCLMLFGQLSKNRGYQIHSLAAMLHRGLQDIEETAHGLQQHDVM